MAQEVRPESGMAPETEPAEVSIAGIDPATVASLTLAYVGDSVYELIVRTIALRRHNGRPNDLNSFAKKYSNAQMQAKLADLLQDSMSESEMGIYKRGRNAKSVSAPHSCTISEYRRATGLEALCAWLYLAGDMARAEELVRMGIELAECED